MTSGGAVVELSAKRVGPPRAFRVLPSLAAVVSVVALMCIQTEGFVWLWLSSAFLGPVFAASVGFAMFGEGLARRLFPYAEGGLRVEGESLYWNGDLLLSKGAIRDAIAYTNGPRHGVRVQTAWRTEHFEVRDAVEADGMVAALGKDSRQAALGFSGSLSAFAASSSAASQAASWFAASASRARCTAEANAVSVPGGRSPSFVSASPTDCWVGWWCSLASVDSGALGPAAAALLIRRS